MTGNPRLSVVMPVHNGMPYVEECISSVLAQSFTDFEFLIGDDGSTDGTSDAVQRFAAADPRIRYLRRPRKSGLAASADWLVREAAAPLVAIAHADDVSKKDRLHWQLRAFQNYPDLQLLGTLWESIDQAGRLVRSPETWRLTRRSIFAPFAHSSVMLRKAAYLAVGGYRPGSEYWEDLDLYLRIGELGQIGVLADGLVRIRHSPVSTRLRDDRDAVEKRVDLMYRSMRLYQAGGDYTPLISARSDDHDSKLDPRTFVACGWTNMWDGRPPRVLWRMLRRSSLSWNLVSARSLAWAMWAEISPRSLRTFVRLLGLARNRFTSVALDPAAMFEWQPRSLRTANRPSDVAPISEHQTS